MRCIAGISTLLDFAVALFYCSKIANYVSLNCASHLLNVLLVNRRLSTAARDTSDPWNSPQTNTRREHW